MHDTEATTTTSRRDSSHDVALPRPDAPFQLVDGGRLVAGWAVRADDLEAAAGSHGLFDRAVFRVGDYWMFSGESHATRVEACTDKFLPRACTERQSTRR